MDNSKTIKMGSSFPLFETIKPKFNSSQISIENNKPKTKVELSRSCTKLKVGRSGKIGFSK